jgi:light-regulated signal transduction histidine kinase (bacteriophytochrome)
MDEPEQPAEPTAACAEDLERIRGLTEALRRARDEHDRFAEAIQETAKLVHSLNNVLSIVASFSATLSDELEPNHAAKDSLEELQRAAKRAIGVARKLVDVQRKLAKEKPAGHGRA